MSRISFRETKEIKQKFVNNKWVESNEKEIEKLWFKWVRSTGIIAQHTDKDGFLLFAYKDEIENIRGVK